EIGIVDQSGESSVAESLKLSAPTGNRHPHLDLDFRIGRWSRCRRNATEGGQRAVKRAHVATGERRGRPGEGAWRDDAGLGELRRRQRHVCKTLACVCAARLLRLRRLVRECRCKRKNAEKGGPATGLSGG